jgi:hypothetical protein
MTTDEKLAAILAAVQTDPGNRGLGRDPHDNLFTATKGDFEAACRSITGDPKPVVDVVTGFYIPTATPPGFETDGPLGAVFLSRAFHSIGIHLNIQCELRFDRAEFYGEKAWEAKHHRNVLGPNWTHVIALERSGPATDGRHYTMRGRDISAQLDRRVSSPYFVRSPHATTVSDESAENGTWMKTVAPETVPWPTIGIGDGGNEIGMGKIPHETIVKNIPNGDLIHCRVPTDHLIVAGVSNWGAYALAAGVYVFRGVKPPPDLFDPDREREILEVMVREGPLVDGVTGKQTATVDGLTWDEYVKPLVRIREILES